MKQKKRTRAARKVRRLVRRVSVERLTRAMPKYVVPSIGDHPEYMRGYSDAVAKLHSLLTPNRRIRPIRRIRRIAEVKQQQKRGEWL